MNYQLNHGRFTDDWSICVVRTSAVEEKKKSDMSVLHENPAQLEMFQEIWGSSSVLNGLSFRLGALRRQINHISPFFPLFTKAVLSAFCLRPGSNAAFQCLHRS